MVKKAGKRAFEELRKAKYMQIDDAKTVNYGDEVNIDDLPTVGYNSNTEMNLADKRTPATSFGQQQAKRIIKNTKT